MSGLSNPMRSQYQSLSSHDDDVSPVMHRVAAFEVDATATSTAVLAPGAASSAVLSRKQRQGFYYLVGSLFVLGFIGVIAVINARGGLGGVKPVAVGGANVFAADGSGDTSTAAGSNDADAAKQLHKKLHEVFAGLEPCKHHCDDACVVTPVTDDRGHVTRFCCDWAYDRHVHLQTCSQTFHPETGACLCTARLVDETVEHRLEALLLPTTRPADDSAASAAPADASPRPSAMPTIPPWSQYIPDPYNLWHTRTPSAAPSVAVEPPAAPAAAEPEPQPPTDHDHHHGPGGHSDHSDADESSEDAEDEVDAKDAAEPPAPAGRR